ncbi:MAG: biotin/lipoyl-containing protein [Bacilli bacterium]|nr:biotin/lipoyl-containing protein [Bacilli bacterium]
MKVYKIKVNGKSYRVELEAIENVGASAPVSEAKPSTPAPAAAAPAPKADGPVAGNEVLAPIQGVISNVLVKVGDKVKKGDQLLIIEAMKLENPVVSPFDGEVAEILVAKGQNVAAKDRIVVVR